MHRPPTSQSVNRVGSNPFGPLSSLIFFVVGLLCRFEDVVVEVVVDDFCVSSTSFFDAADLCVVVVVVASKSSFPMTSVFPDDQKTTAALRPKHQGTFRPPKPPPPLENAFDESIIIESSLSRKKKKTKSALFLVLFLGKKMAQNSPSFFPFILKRSLSFSLSLSTKTTHHLYNKEVVMSAMSYNGAAIIGALFFFFSFFAAFVGRFSSNVSRPFFVRSRCVIIGLSLTKTTTLSVRVCSPRLCRMYIR